MTVMSSTSDQDQEKLLADAITNVKCQSFQMQRCFDKSKVMDGLKHANTMLGELRTSILSPKSYYELYMVICDELTILQSFLVDAFNNGRKIPELYELVQYASNILPRLYLLITVGLVYIKTNQYSRRTILVDLVEMCRGVQHPLRGLFLRNYLLQCCKNVLPDCLPPPMSHLTPSPLENEGQGDEIDDDDEQNKVDAMKKANLQADFNGTIEDSIEFVLVNFAEMNKLWVRIQHQGHSRDREKRERERMELRILVGTNLVRLSQLENISVNCYKSIVLPGILEQVLSCHDPISQEYLMECIIQVFPDDFHLATLSSFLGACSRLELSVNVKNVIVALIDRLANYAHKCLKEEVEQSTMNHENKKSDEMVAVISDSNESARDSKQIAAVGGVPDHIQLFDIFSREIALMMESRAEGMQPADIVSLQTSLANLARKCYPTNVEYLDTVFAVILDIFKQLQIQRVKHMSPVDRELQKLIKLPLSDCSTSHLMKLILHQLPHFKSLINLLDYESRCQVSTFVLNSLFSLKGQELPNSSTPSSSSSSSSSCLLESVNDLDCLLNLVSTLVVDQNDGMSGYDRLNSDDPLTRDEFVEEQALIGSLVHFISDEIDVNERFEMLKCFHTHLHKGGPSRICRTYTPLAFAVLKSVSHLAENCTTTDHEQCGEGGLSVRIRTMLSFLHESCLTPLIQLATGESSEVALRIYLQCVSALDLVHLSLLNNTHISDHSDEKDARETMAYEFMSQAFAIYEDEIGDTRSQLAALHLITGTLESVCCVFGNENHEPLRTQCATAASTKVVKRADQCRGLNLTSHLFWSAKVRSVKDDGSFTYSELRDEKKVSDYLKKSLKMAAHSIDLSTRVQLQIEILDKYIYFYEQIVTSSEGGVEPQFITLQTVQTLMNDIKRDLAKLLAVEGDTSPPPEVSHALRHFDNTLRHIKMRAPNDDKDEGVDSSNGIRGFNKIDVHFEFANTSV